MRAVCLFSIRKTVSLQLASRVASSKICSSKAISGNAQQKPRSPYAILHLQSTATVNEIKASFRRLAKKHHPDLNPQQRTSGVDSNSYMTELISAYNKLLTDYNLSSDIRDSRVSLDCEVYSIDELKHHAMYDVYTLRILYTEEDLQHEKLKTPYDKVDENSSSVDEAVIEVISHPDDSVSDLKRRIQSEHAQEWCLDNRKTDRDKLWTGWELVDSRSRVLSYHLFLHSYGIKNRDLIYAVVRKYVNDGK